MNAQQMDDRARHFRQCVREARVVAVIWLAGLVWVCGSIAATGYLPIEQRPDPPPLVLGIPSWVFWSLFVPWLACIAATWWFAVCILKDDETADGASEQGESAP